MSSTRKRCLTKGCNPILLDETEATNHRNETGHRTAKWPVRSAEGQRRAKLRNKTGYYDKYNVGAKSAVARGIAPPPLFPNGDPGSSVVGGYFGSTELTERELEQIEEYGSTESEDWQDAVNYEAYRDRLEDGF